MLPAVTRARPPAAVEAAARTEGEPLSYEVLRRVERAELRVPRLTRLEATFWHRLAEHMEGLRRAFAEEQEREPTSRRTVLLADELRSTERLASSIWEVRERKIMQEALAALRLRDRARPAPPEHMTPGEAELYGRLVEVLEQGRVRTMGGAPTAPRARRSGCSPSVRSRRTIRTI